MAGILNRKQRILDTIVTVEGRRQLFNGDLQIKFASFTDGDTFYEADAVSGSSDPFNRIFFEATSLPQDQVTFEADDSGQLRPIRRANLGIIGTKVLTGSSLPGQSGTLNFVTGAAFSSTANALLDTSIDAFRRLGIVGTRDLFFGEDTNFIVSPSEMVFSITDGQPLQRGAVKDASVDDIENLMQDRRLAHLPNFRYLPPLNAPDAQNPEGSPLGDYPRIGQTDEYSYEELERDISVLEEHVINFTETSTQNNLIAQFFEKRVDGLNKLDVIDFGEFSTSDPDFPNKHVFFVGKLFIDSFGAHTFVNLFTLIFD